MVPKTSDGRVLFAVPWHDKVLVGTTDTNLDDHSLEPQAQEQEIEFPSLPPDSGAAIHAESFQRTRNP